MFGLNKATQKNNVQDSKAQDIPAVKHTIETLQDMDGTEFDLIAFALSGKVAGRISSISMSLAGTQVRLAAHLDESDQPAIDEFNESLAELDAIESQNEFFSNAGIQQPVNREDELRSWLGVRQIMVDRGFVPTQLSENFKWMIEQTIKRNNPSEDDLKALVAASNITEKQMKDIYKAKSDRAIKDTVEVAKHAMRLINDYEPDTSRTPDNFHDIFEAAIDASQKTAVIRGNNTEESIANLVLLKAMHDS